MDNKRSRSSALLALLLCAGAAVADNGCITCHSNEDFYARYPKLYNYYHDWVASPHAMSGVTCDDCHGGNPGADTAEAAHEGIYPMSDKRSSLYFSTQPATCGGCHSDKQKAFEQSKHFLALKNGTKVAPTCTTCHPAMNKRPTYETIVLDACTTCHGANNRQGLPDITADAESLLRHVNSAHGMIGWAKLHFEAQNWPGDSRAQMRQLDDRYADIVSQIHSFNLEKSDAAAMQLLADLQVVFEASRQKSASGASP